MGIRLSGGPLRPNGHRHFFPWTPTDCRRAHEEWGAQAHHHRRQPRRRGGHRSCTNHEEQLEPQLGLRRRRQAPERSDHQGQAEHPDLGRWAYVCQCHLVPASRALRIRAANPSL
eukprot:9286878-Pyramimonas_sp.AAC.1